MSYHLSIPLVLCLFTFNGECDNKATPTKAECKKSAIRYVEERIAPQQSSSVSIKNLKELLSMLQESVIDTCDLSNQQLSKIPILRQYKIKVLILSHNQLKGKINVFDLPPVLEVLDISHNRLTGSLYLNNYAKKLKRVLCQYNDLEALSVPLSTVYVDASHNRLWAFYLEDDKSKEGPFPSLSAPQGTLNKSSENTNKISKYRNFNELRYFSFIPTHLLRVRKEVANTPKILSNGYNLATFFRAD